MNEQIHAEKPIDLDKLLTVEEGAAWLQMTPQSLLENIRRKRIPAMKINRRVFRIHPRTVLAAKGSKL